MGNNDRCFTIKTPVGDLRVYSKHEVDTSEDFPGVYVDLVLKGVNIPLACIEFDSCNNKLQSCVYSDGLDDSPTHIVKHFNVEA